MKQRIEELWSSSKEHISSSALPLGKFRLVRLDSESKNSAYFGCDHEGRPVIGLPFTVRYSEVAFKSLAVDSTWQQRIDGSWILILRLTIQGAQGVFGRLCEDLAFESSMYCDAKSYENFVIERMHQWRKLFSRARDGVLSMEDIRALLSELLVLEYLIIERGKPAVDVLHAWKSPVGSAQDFQFPEYSVEVKSILPKSLLVSISSFEQLDSDFPIYLTIVHMRSSTAEDAVSLSAAVLRCAEFFASEPTLSSVFRQKILDTGYVACETYDSTYFRIEGIRFYSVGVGFPLIRKSSLVPGIEGGSYSIRLTSLSGFEEEKIP